MPEFLIPLALVIVVALIVPRKWLAGDVANPAIIRIFLIAASVVIARYLHWRVTETLPFGADVGGSEAVFAWVLFSIEMATWCDTVILFLTLSRQRNNSALADLGEDSLRSQHPENLPDVDVFIATYNEDIDVLEKTIVGAMALEWPSDRINIYVLDDGKRKWLANYCKEKGVYYLTRDGNVHAKAGNINAAIKRTAGKYFMVLDADFVPQQNFLFRAMGLFVDPKVGIVQIPHNFYNADPMQTNLGLRKVLPDDQRLFFDKIMCGRDGWDAAFCCGSNSITRRTAIEAIGGGLPTGSITEDMLLTMSMLREGFITRYLNERLAVGLAPESLSAMYVQRARWARGAIQMLFLRSGPLGPGLSLLQRVMFLPLHWITQPLMVIATLLTPTICLWTGWSPLPSITMQAILSFQIPAVLTVLISLRLIAPKAFFPLASIVHTAIHAPRILPTIITTLIKPHGHAFKVTPKGSAAIVAIDSLMIYGPIILILFTALGLYLNMNGSTRILGHFTQLPMLAFWSVASMIVLSIVQVVAVSAGGAVRSERFDIEMPCVYGTKPGERLPARVENVSMTGGGLCLTEGNKNLHLGQWVYLKLPKVSPIAAVVVRRASGTVGMAFVLPPGSKRDALLRLLYTNGIDNSTHTDDGLGVMAQMITSALWKGAQSRQIAQEIVTTQPLWLRQQCERADAQDERRNIEDSAA